MENQGKIGAQNKFPRVMKNKLYKEWQEFVDAQRKEHNSLA